jgi:two-component system aerobic respiration control sensor histidine kinase ArcB
MDIFEKIPGHVYWKSIAGKFLGCNKQQAKSFGLNSIEEVIGKTDYDFNQEKDADYIRSIDNRVIREGIELLIEEPIFDKKSKKTIFYLSKKAPLYDDKNKIIGVIGISIDASPKIKELQEAHLQKEESDVTLKTILSLMPGHVFWKNKDGVFLGCNTLQAKAIGYDSPSEVIGKTAYDTLPKEQADKITAVDREIMAAGKSITIEEESDYVDGKSIYLSKKVPLKNKHNQIVGILGISFDITERKKLETELLNAKQSAEAASHAKSEFLRNMEHQLRTPFSGVYSIVELLSAEETDPEKKQLLEMTYQSAKEFLDLLNQIIDFSRDQASSTPVLAKKFDLKATIEHVIVMEKAAATAKKIKLAYDYPEIPNIYIGDPYRIQRIVLNLVSNAIRFTREGSVRVFVRCAEQLDEKNYVLQVVVADTGIGISEEQQQYIYEKFYRAHPANQNTYLGAGLGLYSVKQLMADLDGEIEVVSSPGKGSTFTCTIPFRRPLTDKMAYNE